MAKSELKTKKTKRSVTDFLNNISDSQRKKDSKIVLNLMKEVTGKKPVMWGSSIVGFGDYHYKYSSGREGDYFMVGLSPRKENLTIYIMPGYQDYGAMLKKLGPHKLGKSCLYIKKLEDVHLPTLRKIIARGYKDMEKYVVTNYR